MLIRTKEQRPNVIFRIKLLKISRLKTSKLQENLSMAELHKPKCGEFLIEHQTLLIKFRRIFFKSKTIAK